MTHEKSKYQLNFKSIHIPIELHAEIKRIAEETGHNIKGLVKAILKDYLKGVNK